MTWAGNAGIATGQQHAQGYGGGARPNNGCLHRAPLATGVDAATKTASLAHFVFWPIRHNTPDGSARQKSLILHG